MPRFGTIRTLCSRTVRSAGLRRSGNAGISACKAAPLIRRSLDGFAGILHMTDCELKTEYPFLKSADLKIENLAMQGKYSFQYVENVTIRNSVLDTKDAFWHSKNVTVYDSIVKGEYLAWYSENLRLVRCKIIGTQPLCYAKGLVLEDCEMEGAIFRLNTATYRRQSAERSTA